ATDAPRSRSARTKASAEGGYFDIDGEWVAGDSSNPSPSGPGIPGLDLDDYNPIAPGPGAPGPGAPGPGAPGPDAPGPDAPGPDAPAPPSTATVPEPSTLVIFSVGAVGLAVGAARRGRRE